MEIDLLRNAEVIRSSFKLRFVATWEEFQISHRDWVDSLAVNGDTYAKNWYDNSLLWEKLNFPVVVATFDEALSYLSTKQGRVMFMAEGSEHPYPGELQLFGQKFVDFVAIAEAEELAQLIRQEWAETNLLYQMDMYYPNPILPDDIYVFDKTMDWLLVFTHETTDCEIMSQAENRCCIIHKKLAE